MTDKDNFESRLLGELRQVSADNPAPRPQPTRSRSYGRFAAVGAGLAAVVAGIAIFTSTGGNTQSAYAVESQPDGSVQVEVNNLDDAAGLEESLNAAGVPAVVRTTPVKIVVCADESKSGGAGGKVPVDTNGTDADKASFSIDPGAMGDGEQLVITPSDTGPDGPFPADAPSASPIAVVIAGASEAGC
ncbi:MAG: hypothetical protein KDB48_00130 [Solirubrobacterales bacterium]|nr:hypothetical protein [Solirubrobacterales bacterium]HMT04471.1 hypothetical protein [Solirubrobacterales bacterium]